MGYFANRRADKERMNPKYGSGFTKTPGVVKRTVRKTAGALVDAATGKIVNTKAARTIQVLNSAIQLAKKGKCGWCKKDIRNAQRDVCSASCAAKLEAVAYNSIQDTLNGSEYRDTSRANWNRITGGIQYDEEGKRIW